jgi:hypothetical protein
MIPATTAMTGASIGFAEGRLDKQHGGRDERNRG